MLIKDLIAKIRDRRDKRFLRRLERVLSTNILQADILFRGSIGAQYNIIKEDELRRYDLSKGFRSYPDLPFPASQVRANDKDPGRRMKALDYI